MNGRADAPASTDVAILKHPEIEKINHVHHAGNSSRHRRWFGSVLVATRVLPKNSLETKGAIVSMAAIGSEPTIMPDRPEICRQEGAGSRPQ